MPDTQENSVSYKVEIKEFRIEIDQNYFLPQWFQTEFGKLLNEILQENIKGMNPEVNEDKEEKKQSADGNESDEYVNWEEAPEENNFTVTGSINFENKTKVTIQVYIGKGESIKSSTAFSYEIDDILDKMQKVLTHIENFVLVRCGMEYSAKSAADMQEYYPRVVKLLEENKEDNSPEKHFAVGIFLAKAGYEEESLENLDFVIGNSPNPEMIQDCYKVVLEVKAKKNMKDLENARKEVYAGDPSRAIPLVESLIEITPKYIHLHFLLGMAYKKSGFREKTIEAFKRALEIDPNHVPSLRELAEELVAVSNLSEAEAMYRRIDKLEQANATDYYNLGMCLKRQGRTNELDGIMDKIKELDVEGRLDSYLFNLFEIKPEHLKDESASDKKSIWKRLFGK